MTQNNKYRTLLIDINKHNNIKCSIIDLENKEQQIKINENQQDEYLPICIAFDMNVIIINEQREDSIDFFDYWIEQSEEFKEYEITYQNKQYSVISEVIFALIMNQYISKIEKQYIIEETIVTIPTTNSKLYQRITTSLESIGLRNIIINPLNYEYQTQGEMLQEILEKNNAYNK